MLYFNLQIFSQLKIPSAYKFKVENFAPFLKENLGNSELALFKLHRMDVEVIIQNLVQLKRFYFYSIAFWFKNWNELLAFNLKVNFSEARRTR